MSEIDKRGAGVPAGDDERELERLLEEGITLTPSTRPASPLAAAFASRADEEEEEEEHFPDSDIQGSLGLFAESSQDMATASVELGLGRHFACVDFCNQAVEKAAQAVSLRHFGRRSMYDHDLRALGTLVGAPDEIADEMAKLTPFHPEAFYMDTPPEEADAVIDAEQAGLYIQSARKVLRWAKSIVLNL
jgi:HEPN domain-containing protein